MHTSFDIAAAVAATKPGKGLADETQKAMNGKGLKEVMYEGVNPGEKDYSALVSKLKQAAVDVVYFGGLHTEAGLIIRQMRDQGLQSPMMSGDGITSDEFATIGGDGVVGTLLIVHDMSFVTRRSEDTRKYVLLMFTALGVSGGMGMC